MPISVCSMDRRAASRRLQASIASLSSGDDGSEVVEYALLIGFVVIGLVLALGTSTASLPAAFTNLYLRVAACLTPGTTNC